VKGGSGSWWIVSLAALGLTVLVLEPYGRQPFLIWNASPSAPVGLYRLVPDTIQTGRRVAVRPPEEVRALGVRLGVMRAGDLLIKTYAAGAGDLICEREGHLERNGVRLAPLVAGGYGPGLFDAGAPCRRLSEGEVLLLGDGSRSWDGRSFGVLSVSGLIGVVERIGGP